MTAPASNLVTPPPLPCARCFSAIEPGDLRCPVCFLAVPDKRTPEQPLPRVQALRCGSCGAAMEYSARSQAPICAFCGGVLKLEEFVDPEERIEKRLPFTVDGAQASQIYKQWIARQGFFRPFNLAAKTRLESLRAVWWTGWVVDARALATWTADSDFGAQKAKWAPHAGETQSEFNDLVIPATRGLTGEECARLIATYDLTGAAEDVNEPGRDVEVERFETPRSVARATIVGTIKRLMGARIQNGEIPGRRFRNLQSSIHLRRLVTRRVAFPAYVIAYRYRGRVYRTVISGQDPACVIGEAPRSIGKLILAVILGLVALGTAAGLLRLAAGN